jgi:hypothetical protein
VKHATHSRGRLLIIIPILGNIPYSSQSSNMAFHSRSPSDGTTSTAGGSYQLILEHILSHPGTYEIPLRNMYHLNCLPTASVSRSGSPTRSRSPTPDELNTAQFTSSLFEQITRLPTQPCSLPPAFINSFLRRCFPRELNQVDFPQALTALDYLKDLEFRRRRDHEAALARLDIGTAEVSNHLDGFHQCIKEWAGQMEMHERKVEAVYSNLFVALRRWVLINELTIEPFCRHNCLAMLNTLYPPAITSQPTSRLTPDVLKRQREGFFSYIQAVERKGPIVLRPLMEQNANDGEAHGWPKVRDILDKYLRVSLMLIEQYAQVTSASDMIAAYNEQEERRKRKEKADSGVSFGSVTGHRPSFSPEKRKSPPSPVEMQRVPMQEKRTLNTLSTIEKIARELRKFRENRKRSGTFDSTEKENGHIQNFTTLTNSFQSTASAPLPQTTPLYVTVPQQQHAETRIAKGLRKIKSLGDVKVARNAQAAAAPPMPVLPPTFASEFRSQSPARGLASTRGSMDRLRGFRKPLQRAYEV